MKVHTVARRRGPPEEAEAVNSVLMHPGNDVIIAPNDGLKKRETAVHALSYVKSRLIAENYK